MKWFRLGVEELLHEFGDAIVFTRISQYRNPLISKFEVVTKDTEMMYADCLYLYLGDTSPSCRHMQPGTTIIFCDKSLVNCDNSCNQCNIIALDGVEPKQLVNRVSTIFSSYFPTSRKLAEMILTGGDDKIMEILEIASKFLGIPLAIIDEKLDVIATSNHKEMYPNPLWETIMKDDKIQRCKLLDNQNGEIYRLGSKGLDALSPNGYINVFSGFETASCDIFWRSVPAGRLWGFQIKPNQHFGAHQIHFMSWLANSLGYWVPTTKLITPSRGLKRERFMFDLSRGIFQDNEECAIGCGLKCGMQSVRGPEFQMVMIRPSQVLRPESMIRIMSDIEKAIPPLDGALKDIGIFGLFPVEKYGYMPEKFQHELEVICQTEGLCAILSSPFFRLTSTPSVIDQLCSCFNELINKNDVHGLYFYHDFMVKQSMHIVLEKQPAETMVHPLIRKIMDYDEQNQTDYLKTFKVYLNNRCNVTDAARQMHMHRNTMLHRAKRIEELLGCNFDDWELRRSLLLSFDYLYLNENMDI